MSNKQYKPLAHRTKVTACLAPLTRDLQPTYTAADRRLSISAELRTTIPYNQKYKYPLIEVPHIYRYTFRHIARVFIKGFPATQ